MYEERRDIMGMPIAVHIAGVANDAAAAAIAAAFDYFAYVDGVFSTYKPSSEITAINEGRLAVKDRSDDIKLIFALAEKTKTETKGYFDIKRADGTYDPSGIVKGWAIKKAADLIAARGFAHFFIDAGGDIEARGLNDDGEPWTVGIKNPLNEKEIVKVLRLSDRGVATSGTYIRGLHIYDPLRGRPAEELASLTVVGPDVYEADRFATAAFAMGAEGIYFIEKLPGFEGYAIDHKGIATMTTGFQQYVV